MCFACVADIAVAASLPPWHAVHASADCAAHVGAGVWYAIGRASGRSTGSPFEWQ